MLHLTEMSIMYFFIMKIQRCSQKFVSKGDKTGTGNRSPPEGSRGRALVGPPEAEDISQACML